MRFFFIGLLVVVACTPGRENYKPESIARDEGAVIGRVKVVYNGSDLTSKCAVCFRTLDGPCYQLDASGYVAMTLTAGACSIRRIACNADGERHVHFKGYRFDVAPLAKNFFGDVRVDWQNEHSGFKPSILFGLVGAVVDQSTNDGDATLSVASSKNDVLSWYDGLVKHKDALPLRESVVSFIPTPLKLTAERCAPLVPAVVVEDAEVHERPDHSSVIVGTLPAETAVCTGSSSVGYGYRRVKSPTGVDGYVRDLDLSL
jgi:hypothetical protein